MSTCGIPAMKWLKLEFCQEFRRLIVLLLKNVSWDLKLPAGRLEAYVSDNRSISIVTPDLDSALSQKGRFFCLPHH